MMAFLVLCVVFAGLAGWVPAAGPDRSAWIGLRLTVAVAAAQVMVFVLAWLGGVAFSTACWITAAAAIAGLPRLAREIHSAPGHLWGHPVFVFPTLLAAIMVWNGPLDYLPLGWDEYANWLGWARAMVMDDRVWALEMPGPIPGYSPGLPILMALPSALLGRYDDTHSMMLQFIMHVGLLGMVFDLCRSTLKRDDQNARQAALAAWVVVLLALAVEATWKLLPPQQLIEKPQVYLVSAFAVLMVIAARQSIHPWRLALMGGLLIAHGYLIKLGMQLFIPSAILLALPVMARSRQQSRALALGLALPVALAILAWKLAGIPDVYHWNAIVGPLLDRLHEVGPSGMRDLAVTVALDYWPAVLDYLKRFKPWLTLAALAGFALAWRRWDARAAAVALIGFLVLNLAVVYAFHIKWAPYPELNSIDRFTRVPLRPVHLLGLVLGLLAVLEWGWGRLSRWRLAAPALTVMVAALLALQVWQTRAVLIQAAERPADPRVRVIRGDTERLAALLLRRGQAGVSVQMLDQGQDGFARLIADYFAQAHDGRRVIRLFSLEREYSWSPATAPWAVAVSAGALAEALAGRTVIWPVTMNPWLTEIVAPMVDDPACRQNLVGYFLFRRPQGGFDCVAKAAAP